jgi:predicted RNA-binding Zn ribbon-like protein
VLFAHDTERALAAAAALVNTDQPDGDVLSDVGSLRDFVRAWKWTGVTRGDEAELAAVRALRPRLRSIWCMDADAAAELVNALLREGRALPQLVNHDGWEYHLHATAEDAPLAERMVVDVIRQSELERLQVCAADTCGDVLVDLSKNRSRRFCSTSCANRTNVAAFRARRR